MQPIATTWQQHWQPDLIGTLVFVLSNDDVLLIHKKTGHGQGKISAPGGKLESGEGRRVRGARTAGRSWDPISEPGLPS